MTTALRVAFSTDQYVLHKSILTKQWGGEEERSEYEPDSGNFIDEKSCQGIYWIKADPV